MSEFRFKATGMYDFYSESTAPEYYTVLAKKKGKGHKWVYAGKDGKILKFDTLKQAKEEAEKLKVKTNA